MPLFKDQTGFEVKIHHRAKRIISLVPSQTELLYDLGLRDEVVGITKFCVHPDDWFRSKTRVGGTKNLNIDVIQSLMPDLIIANKEENVKDQIELLRQHYPVWTSDVNTLTEALDMITQVGKITNRVINAGLLVEKISQSFSRLNDRLHKASPTRTRVAYLMWNKPLMAAASNTFIDAILKECGFTNIFDDLLRYPIVDINDIRNRHCEFLLLSSEPFPFSEKHLAEMKDLLSATKIVLVDGESFSWYGSRLLPASNYLMNLVSVLSPYSM